MSQRREKEEIQIVNNKTDVGCRFVEIETRSHTAITYREDEKRKKNKSTSCKNQELYLKRDIYNKCVCEINTPFSHSPRTAMFLILQP